MWGMPSHMNPGMYQSQMQGHMTHMRSQMAAIAAEKDPPERQALLREHYQTHVPRHAVHARHGVDVDAERGRFLTRS